MTCRVRASTNSSDGRLDAETYAGDPLDGLSLVRTFDSLVRLNSLSANSTSFMLNQID